MSATGRASPNTPPKKVKSSGTLPSTTAVKKLPPPLDEVELVDDAVKVVGKVEGAEALMPAIAVMEGVDKVTVPILKYLGSGMPSGVVLTECESAKDKAATRQELAKALLILDRGRLARLTPFLGADPAARAERRRLNLTAIARMLSGLMDALEAPLDSKPDGKSERVLIATSEEDRAYSSTEFSVDNMKDNMRMLHKMYNMKVRPWDLATHSSIKKVHYAANVDEVFPDPRRVPLESMRQHATDTGYTLLHRLVHTFLAVVVGKKVGLFRDEGAGVLAGYADQWANAEPAKEMLAELAELRDRLPSCTCRCTRRRWCARRRRSRSPWCTQRSRSTPCRRRWRRS